jgi:hypothetical protein
MKLRRSDYRVVGSGRLFRSPGETSKSREWDDRVVDGSVYAWSSGKVYMIEGKICMTWNEECT